MCKGERITLRHWPPLLAVIEDSLALFIHSSHSYFITVTCTSQCNTMNVFKEWKSGNVQCAIPIFKRSCPVASLSMSVRFTILLGVRPFGTAVNTFIFGPGRMTLRVTKLFPSLTRPLRFAQSVRHTWCLLWASHYVTLGWCVCVQHEHTALSTRLTTAYIYSIYSLTLMQQPQDGGNFNQPIRYH